MAAVIVLSAMLERSRLSSEFTSEATILHRLLSQRADQHDAHMTALSALASADGSSRPDLFLQVAATIIRFYLRIVEIDLVALDASGDFLTTRPGLSTEQTDVQREAAFGSDGRIDVRPTPWTAGRYLLIKRSPNTLDALFALALEVDGAALMDLTSQFWERPAVNWSLLLPDGVPVAGARRLSEPDFEKVLGSPSQPLVLQADFAPRPMDLLPLGRLAAVMTLTALGYLGLVLGFGQYARARRAERQADFSAQEARLAHASRVNALGEMASGIAHELTQPLTAILSQAQAGQHLARRGDTDVLETAMQTIADQAKRASAILERLRNWTLPIQDANPIGDVGTALQNVYMLLAAEAAKRGVGLRFAPLHPPVAIRGDQIELEQIVFNLVRNAIEAASKEAAGDVSVLARRAEDDIIVDVADNGPGVAIEVSERLFEPSFTTKPSGTGLGLALCRRLAERMEGEVQLVRAHPALFRLRLPVHVPPVGGTLP